MVAWFESAPFRGVSDLTVTAPSTSDLSQLVRQKLINTLPPRALAPFINDASYIGKGFEMWGRLQQKYSPHGTMATFTTFMKLFHLKQGAQEPWGAYLARVRGLDNLLRGKTVSDLIVLFATFAADTSRYGELGESFRRGDAAVINADLSQLEDLGEAIDSRREAESSFGAPTAPSANRAQDKGGSDGEPRGRSKDKPSTPPVKPDDDKAGGRKRPSYPPNPSPWATQVRELIRKGKECPICFQTEHVKRDEPCVTCAREGFLLIKDAKKAAAFVEKWTIDHPRPEKRVKLTGDDDDTGKAPVKGRRAASQDKTPPSEPDPSSHNRYQDAALSSDDNDDAEFQSNLDIEWTEVVKGSRNDKNKTVNTPYLPRCRRSLVSRSPAPTSRFSSAALMSHATNVFQIAASEIFKRESKSSSSACADSGATDHMIPH